jgi:hypothetical protein
MRWEDSFPNLKRDPVPRPLFSLYLHTCQNVEATVASQMSYFQAHKTSTLCLLPEQVYEAFRVAKRPTLRWLWRGTLEEAADEQALCVSDSETLFVFLWLANHSGS